MTESERTVGEAFRHLIPQREGRVLIASFASNIHRVQQAMDVAAETGRRVCLVGRSLRKNVNIARNLGYLDVSDELLVKPDELDLLGPRETMILCTGSQGEPMSALTRMAYHDHANVAIEETDTVIISAKPVPGNELRVHDTINRLAKSGAEVLHQEIAQVHVSGHGNAEEIRTVLAVLRPATSCPCTASSACSPPRRASPATPASPPTGSCSPRTAPSSSCAAASPASRVRWRSAARSWTASASAT